MPSTHALISTTEKTLLLFSAIFYATFLLEVFYGFPLSPQYSYLSEYSAASSAYRWAFAGADTASSVLLLGALGLLAYSGGSGAQGGSAYSQRHNVAHAQSDNSREGVPSGSTGTQNDHSAGAPASAHTHSHSNVQTHNNNEAPQHRIGQPGWRGWTLLQRLLALAFALSALFTLADSAFPLPCAESLPQCSRTGIDAHQITSSLVATAQVSAALIMCSVAWLAPHRQPVRKHCHARSTAARGSAHQQPAWKRYVVFTSAFGFLLSCAIFMLAYTNNWPVGIIQRIQVFFMCTMILSIELALGRYVDHSSRLGVRTPGL